MRIDANDVARDTTLSADVCVIGAGAAGITLARALAASRHTVLLLESGGFRPDRRTQALYRGKAIGLPIDPTVDLGLDAPRLRYFGGSTNHWAGYCGPFPGLDFERRAYVPRSGWPIAHAELDPYYDGAVDVCGLGPNQFSIGYWRRVGLLDQPFLESPTWPHTVVQLSQRPVFGSVYRDEIVDSPDIQLVLHANVTRLALGGGGAALSGVDVETLAGNSFTATAQAYVLATGGLEVPRLLLASNDVRPSGIGNEHDLVGRHFMEHVNVAAGPVALTLAESALAPYTPTVHTITAGDEEREASEVVLQALVTLAPGVLQREELRACSVTLGFPFAPDDPRIEGIYPGTWRGIQLLEAQGIVTKTVATARVLCEQEPNPASRVTLARDRDELGMPRIQLDWRLTRDDRLSMLRTLGLLGREVGRRGFGRLRVDVFGYRNADPGPDDDVDFPVNTGSHHMGTARMSASPSGGVVDANCKVHSVANLYVAGSAVFPTSGANTPTLTIVALALRLADHLATRVPGTSAVVQTPDTRAGDSGGAGAEPVDGA